MRRHERARDTIAAGPADVFSGFFRDLEDSGISYAVLHDHAGFPATIRSDVDFAVAPEHLSSIDRLAMRSARRFGWVLVHVRWHEPWSCYLILVDPCDPRRSLALDACAHYTRDGASLLDAALLLDGRRRHPKGFFITSASAEFAYVLAKALAKGREPADVLPRLKELHREDPSGTQAATGRLVDITDVASWLDGGAPDWEELRREMLLGHRFSRSLRARDAARRVRRSLRPSGLMVSFLGSDGTGKSSLVRALPDRVRAAFLASPVVYKFRPDSTHRIVPALDPEPHVREPRSLPTSVLKVAFYAGDWWIGWLRQLLPAQRRGALVLFDRDFADLSADQRRYLVRDVGALSRTVRRLIPRPAVTYVLDASPDVVHARKPELTITELERQRAAYRRLCEHDPRMRLVDAHETTEHVLEAVASDLVMALARRERLRAIPPLTRLRDVAVSAGALVCLSPLMAATALAVRARLGSPILFRQSRPGLLGAPFDLLKFRTMTEDLDPVTGRHRPDAERMTALGTLLRRTSLDELPELLNVLKGDMSLVGPRPLLPRYLPRYSAEQRGRHDVLPGVTGWAQVNGRNAASWDEKFALDLWYVDHRTFWLDLRILLRTAAVVVGGRGVSQPGHATGEEFWGSDGAPGSASPPGQPQGPLERTS